MNVLVRWLLGCLVLSTVLLWGRGAHATCMITSCRAEVLAGDSCKALPDGARVEAWSDLRVKVMCEEGCSPPGGPMSSHERAAGVATMEGVALRRPGCRFPEPVLVQTEQACDAIVARIPAGVASGGYLLEGMPRSAGTVLRVGPAQIEDDPSIWKVPLVREGEQETPRDGVQRACPTAEEHNAWNAERNRLRQERIRLEREEANRRNQLWQEQRRRELEIAKRACTPPQFWTGHTCLERRPDPPPSSASSSASSMSSKDFLDDGDWNDDRADWGFEMSAGGLLGGTRFGEQDLVVGGGGALRVGFRRFFRFKRGGEWSSGGTAWCAPVFCGMIGMIFMPSSVALGNDFGLDAEFQVSTSKLEGMTARIELIPQLRVSRDSRARTQSVVGTFAPSIGLQLPRENAPAELYFAWRLYPVDVRIGRWMAVSWDGPRFGPTIPLDGSPVGVRLTSTLSLSWLSIGD